MMQSSNDPKAKLLWRLIIAALGAACMNLVGGTAEARIDPDASEVGSNLITENGHVDRPCTDDQEYYGTDAFGGYRYLLEVGQSEGNWRIEIEAGANDHSMRLSGEDPKRYLLILTNRNTSSGMRVLTPILNVGSRRDGYCMRVTKSDGAVTPALMIRARISAVVGADGTSPLSIGAASPDDKANFLSAADVRDECASSNGACIGAFDLLDRTLFDRSELPADKLWPLQARAHQAAFLEKSVSARRDTLLAKIDRTIAPIIYLRTVQHIWSEERGEYKICSDRKDGACDEVCTGFLIAPRVVLTNAHCIFGNSEKGRRDSSRPKLVFGWIRPVGGGQFEQLRAPDFQHLTPVSVGTAGAMDYALLYIEDTNFVDRPLVTRPAPLPISHQPTPPSIGQEVTVFGYPWQIEGPNKGRTHLVASFDDFCRMTGLRTLYDTQTKKNFSAVWHLCDTLGGASGSPIFDRDLCVEGRCEVLALHFAGHVYRPAANGNPAAYSDCGEQRTADGGGYEKEGEWSSCANTALPACVLRWKLNIVHDELKNNRWRPPFSPTIQGMHPAIIGAESWRERANKAFRDIWAMQKFDEAPPVSSDCAPIP